MPIGLLLALSGLFAMHGLSDHGATGHLEPAGGHAMERATVGTLVGAAGAAATSDSPSSHLMGMAGLCLAVLVAGLWWAATSLRVGWRSGRAHVPPRLTRPQARARAPDPPDLYRLSIQRC